MWNRERGAGRGGRGPGIARVGPRGPLRSPGAGGRGLGGPDGTSRARRTRRAGEPAPGSPRYRGIGDGGAGPRGRTLVLVATERLPRHRGALRSAAAARPWHGSGGGPLVRRGAPGGVPAWTGAVAGRGRRSLGGRGRGLRALRSLGPGGCGALRCRGDGTARRRRLWGRRGAAGALGAGRPGAGRARGGGVGAGTRGPGTRVAGPVSLPAPARTRAGGPLVSRGPPRPRQSLAQPPEVTPRRPRRVGEQESRVARAAGAGFPRSGAGAPEGVLHERRVVLHQRGAGVRSL